MEIHNSSSSSSTAHLLMTAAEKRSSGDGPRNDHAERALFFRRGVRPSRPRRCSFFSFYFPPVPIMAKRTFIFVFVRYEASFHNFFCRNKHPAGRAVGQVTLPLSPEERQRKRHFLASSSRRPYISLFSVIFTGT